jgi:DNA polymerase
MIRAMGLAREDVYITNVLKCWPPGNRDPEKAEVEACRPFLERQIRLVDPEVIVALGRHAAHWVLGVDAPLSLLRNRVHEVGGRVVVATYHPAACLRNEKWKRPVWEDLQEVMRLLDLPLPESGRRDR